MMNNFLALNWYWLLLAGIGLVLAIYAITKIRKPLEPVVTTKSVNFTEDPVISTPVVRNNPHADIFREAARAAIDGVNPWIYLSENWGKAQVMNVEPALLDFITNEAGQKIPDSSKVSLSVREYSDPLSIVMEYRDPATDSILVATGHDPEPALYATFANRKNSVTYKLVCANGLVRELISGKNINFDHDYVIKEGDSFIKITGSTTRQASRFAEENDLPVRFVVEGKINSKTPNTSRVKVFRDYRNFPKTSGIFDVVLQPGDILRRQDGKWLYIEN